MRGRLAILLSALAALALVPAAATGTTTGVLAGATVSGQAIPCVAQSDGIRVCHGSDSSGPGAGDVRLLSFDATPLEVYLVLPPAPASGNDGDYPLIVQSHGWGQSAGGAQSSEYMGPSAEDWARQGDAVLQLTARGFGDSCGKATPAGALAPCAHGYTHIDDARAEARDVQYAVGLLVDEGVIDPAAIGVTGAGYGGALSLELATLRDRVMNPNGSLVPWTSPAGTPLHIAAAAPVSPWSDLLYALLPNGRTRADAITSPSADLAPLGVAKQSLLAAFAGAGTQTATESSTDAQADLPAWLKAITAGEPYASNPLSQAIIAQLTRYRSPYYLLDGAYGTGSEPPSPLLIGSGFTDELSGADEALRYLNLEHALYPDAPARLIAGDFGTPPAQNKPGDLAVLNQSMVAFFAYYLRGAGTAPPSGATALTKSCPASAPSGGPWTADTFAALHPGQVGYVDASPQTVASDAGSTALAAALDPVGGQGACAALPASDEGHGVASYRLPAASGAGYTLLGAPTVTANLAVTGSDALLAARLWDVDPATNTETLVTRGLYRIDTANPDGTQSFELDPGAWYFGPGHVAKLELLGQDAPYARRSNGAFAMQVSELALVLPVHETAGSAPGVVAGGTALPSPCYAQPSAELSSEQEQAKDSGLVVTGTAGEHVCPGDARSVREREHVTAVSVSIVQLLGHNRCRFLAAGAKLSHPRSCVQPILLPARGTARWQLRLRGTVPRGRYLVSVQAVDGLGRPQRPTPGASTRIRIR